MLSSFRSFIGVITNSADQHRPLLATHVRYFHMCSFFLLLIHIYGTASSVSLLNDESDTALVEQGRLDEPWEQLIISGPMTVNLLGQLMVVSSKLDFSFIDSLSNYQFVFMKYPQSFRATLTQIANGNVSLTVLMKCSLFHPGVKL